MPINPDPDADYHILHPIDYSEMADQNEVDDRIAKHMEVELDKARKEAQRREGKDEQ